MFSPLNMETDGNILDALTKIYNGLKSKQLFPKTYGQKTFFYYNNGIKLDVRELEFLATYTTNDEFYAPKIRKYQNLIYREMENQGFVPSEPIPIPDPVIEEETILGIPKSQFPYYVGGVAILLYFFFVKK